MSIAKHCGNGESEQRAEGAQRTATAASIRGWEQLGSVGDLRIRRLVALGQGARTRVWVVGCFHNPSHPLATPDAESSRNELFALVWHAVLSDVRASQEQAKAFLRGLCHRMSQPFHRTARPNISGLSCDVPNV